MESTSVGQSGLNASTEFARVGLMRLEGILGPDDLTSLREEGTRLLGLKPKPWSFYIEWHRRARYEPCLFAEPGRDTAFLDVIGQSGEVDRIVRAILLKPEVRTLLLEAMGEFRLWQAQIRRANAKAKPLRMHRDRAGEIGLTVLIDDAPNKDGATVFVPRSHRWPSCFSPPLGLSPWFVKCLCAAATGRAGDAYVFNSRIWHGRPRLPEGARRALIMSFLPKSLDEQSRPIPPEILKKLGPVIT